MIPDLREKVEKAAKADAHEYCGANMSATWLESRNTFGRGALWMHSHLSPLIAEQAARIERLETALKQISRANYNDTVGVFTLARDALENK